MTDFSPLVHQAAPETPQASPAHDSDVDALIDAARRHPLGPEFLTEGYLGTVAVTFQVHAFTVEAARRKLRGW